MDVTFRGNRLADAKDVIAYDPGITVEKVEVVNPQEVKAHLKICAMRGWASTASASAPPAGSPSCATSSSTPTRR